MNAQCTHCNTIFRVDPHKIPAGGARARCSICRNVFQVPPAPTSTVPTPAPMPQAAAPAAAPAPVTAPTPQAASPVPAPALQAAAPTPAAPAPTPAPAAAAPAPPTPAPTTAPPATPAPRNNPFAFGANDPGAKARRLARALISDIVTYHPERRDQALGEGTLKREFMEEIKKSWEEYVGQVGTNVARSTPHFRDALNEILAKGQPVF